jgi:hypothetical protein
VRFDEFANGLQNGALHSDVVFERWESGPDGTPRQQKYKGCWLMVDNGYLNWGTHSGGGRQRQVRVCGDGGRSHPCSPAFDEAVSCKTCGALRHCVPKKTGRLAPKESWD